MATLFLPSLVATIGTGTMRLRRAAADVVIQRPRNTGVPGATDSFVGRLKHALIYSFGWLLPLVPTLTYSQIASNAWRTLRYDLPWLFSVKGAHLPVCFVCFVGLGAPDGWRAWAACTHITEMTVRDRDWQSGVIPTSSSWIVHAPILLTPQGSEKPAATATSWLASR